MKIFKKLNKKVLIVSFLLMVSIILIFLGINTNKLRGTVLIQNDNIKVTIDDTNFENDIADFNYSDIKRLKIDVDFKDVTTKNKKIEIELKEGLTYKLYSVLEVTDSNMHNFIEETDVLYKAVNNVTYPEIINTTYLDTNPYKIINYKSSYGKLTYNINDNIEKITLYVDISADFHKLYDASFDEESNTYNNKIIEDAIDVSVFKEDKKINNISFDTRIITDDKYYLEFEKVAYNKYTTNVFASKDADTPSYGFTKSTLFRLKEIGNKLYFGLPNYKQAKFTLYYPKHTDFVDLVYNDGNVVAGCNKVEIGQEKSSNCTIVDIKSNSEEDNKIIVTLNTFNGNFVNAVAVKFKVDTINEIGLSKSDVISWKTKEYDTAEVTFYDDVQKVYHTKEKDALNIYHPDSFENIIQIKNSYSIAEDKDDDTFIYGPSFVITNSTPGVKTNQVIEYNIDPNYQAIAVTFPKESIATLTDIEYKITGSDKWIKLNKDFNNHTFSLNDAGIDMNSNIYFTAVKAVVSEYSEGYVSSISAGSDQTNCVVYGNLNKNVDLATVTLKLYEKPAEDGVIGKTISETRNVVYRSEKTIGAHAGTVEFTDGKSVITSVFTNSDFYISGYLRPHIYPYGTRVYMDNTEIYIKQPKGLVIDLDNLSIKDELNNDLEYVREKHINKFGDVVYILKTKKRTGLDVSKENILKLNKNHIIVKVKYHIEDNCNLTNISLKHMIGIGNPEYVYISRAVMDESDLNANNNLDEIVFYTSENKLLITSAKKFTISSYILKDGKEYGSYNKNNKDTIIKVNPSDEFEYKVNIKNHSESTIDNYEVYIPIAKQNINFGTQYQDKSFEWDLYLQEKIKDTDDYEIYYSTETNQENINNNLSYKKDIDNLNEVTMIKLVSLKPIDSNKEFNINIKLKVYDKDTYLNANRMNINNIVYKINSGTLKGEFKGNSNALQLYSPSISGFVYEDLNIDGVYSEEDKKGIKNIKLELYKLVNNNYEKVSDVELISGSFLIKDMSLLKEGIYGLKIIYKDYKLYSNTIKEDFIKDINISDGEPQHFEIGFIKYQLGFDVSDIIMQVGEQSEIKLENITPSYFNKIKNESIAYEWIINENDSSYVEIINQNNNEIIIKALKETTEDINVCASIYDRYNESFSKCFKLIIKDSGEPIIHADDVHILVGQKIDYQEYIKKAIDYKENNIRLDFNSNVRIVSNIPHINNHATTKGKYEVTYEVTDMYGNIGKKTITIYVDSIKDVVENPSTYDDVIKDYILLNISVLVLSILIAIIISKRKSRIK